MAGNRVDGLACTVGYYGAGIVEDYREKRKVPTLLHFGENDLLIAVEDVVQFRAHRPDVSAFPIRRPRTDSIATSVRL